MVVEFAQRSCFEPLIAFFFPRNHCEWIEHLLVNKSHRTATRGTVGRTKCAVHFLARLVSTPVLLEDERGPFSARKLLLVVCFDQLTLFLHLILDLGRRGRMLPLFVESILAPALCNKLGGAFLPRPSHLLAEQVVLLNESFPLGTQFFHTLPSAEPTPSFLDVARHDDLSERSDLIV